MHRAATGAAAMGGVAMGGGSPDGDGFAHPRPWGPGVGMPVMTGMPGVSGMDMGSMTDAMSMAGQQPPMGHGSGGYPRDRPLQHDGGP